MISLFVILQSTFDCRFQQMSSPRCDEETFLFRNQTHYLIKWFERCFSLSLSLTLYTINGANWHIRGRVNVVARLFQLTNLFDKIHLMHLLFSLVILDIISLSRIHCCGTKIFRFSFFSLSFRFPFLALSFLIFSLVFLLRLFLFSMSKLFHIWHCVSECASDDLRMYIFSFLSLSLCFCVLTLNSSINLTADQTYK